MRIVHFPSLACLVVPGERPGSGQGGCASLGAGKEEFPGRCSSAGEHRVCRGRPCLPAEAAGLEEVLPLLRAGRTGEFAWGCWPCCKRARLRAARRTWGELCLLILLFLLLLAGLAAGLVLRDSESLPVRVGGGCDPERSPLSGAVTAF